MTHEGVPEAIAVLNPAQAGCRYPFKSLCGAAVAFKLAHAILSAAAETEEQRTKLKRGLIPSFLKLVAIATIADSVPLEGENRVIAALGLRELRNPVQPGLRALMEVAQIPAGPRANSHRGRFPDRPADQCGGTYGYRQRCRRAVSDEGASARRSWPRSSTG